MASSSSPRSSGHRTSPPNFLPRGGACVSCRRRKMKCDGTRPVCTQCDRAGRAEDCEYTAIHERSTVQILEENISRLEARIQELQDPSSASASASVSLHQPYGADSSSPPHLQTTSNEHLSVGEPPVRMRETLLEAFFQYASEIGFFLNIPRFKFSIMQGHPLGHPSKPSPALTFSVYLWALRLSGDPNLANTESAYLARAIQEANTALSGTHPHTIMHSIQAEVLLATYFFAKGRFFEGKYHVSNAVSAVILSGLHKIRSTSPSQRTTNPRLPSARDPTEEGERIIGAWTVLNLDTMWATVLEYSPNYEDSTHVLGTRVDTPWPLEMEDFEQGRLPQHVRTANTIQNFITGAPTPDLGLSSRAFEAKAILLWHRAAIFVQKCSASPEEIGLPPLIHEFTTLCSLVDKVAAQGPAMVMQTISGIQSAEKARRLALGFTILKIATITMHAPFARSGRSESSIHERVKCAREILDAVAALRSRGRANLNPVFGVAWVEAAQILFDEVAASRLRRLSGAYTNTDERAILAQIQHATTAMADFGTNIPLITFQVNKIQESYRALPSL